MSMMYGDTGGSLGSRKSALIKKLASQGGRGQGGTRAGGGMPFGSLPRLGFNPTMRSAMGRPETFNHGNAPQGLQQALAAVSGPGNAAPPVEHAPTGGLGPASGSNVGPGNPAAHLDNSGNASHPQAQTGTVPPYMQEFLNGGAAGGNITAWLQANPWFMQQYTGG
jgi:hypothetical protein